MLKAKDTYTHIIIMNDSNLLNKLVNDLIIYHQDLGLAICQPCGIAFPTNFERHLSEHHKTLKHSERQALMNYILSLPNRRTLEQINSTISAEVEREAIHGLPIQKISKCIECGFLGADSTVEKHCRSHNRILRQSNCQQLYS